MRKKLTLLLLAAFLLATPLMADHRHRRDCGHYYDRARGWLSIEVFGRNGGFFYQQAPRRSYYRDGYSEGYYDGRRARHYCERRCRARHKHFYHEPRGRGHGHHHHRPQRGRGW